MALEVQVNKMLDKDKELNQQFKDWDEKDIPIKKETKGFEIDPASIKDEFDAIVTPEIEAEIKELYAMNPQLRSSNSEEFQREKDKANGFTTGVDSYKKEEDWIQTYSGRRFNPIKPYPNSIVIQDIAHALSMQCRFSGHVKRFYSVAQHSVGVSYLCNKEDALWGLLHDASEAYLVDIPSPLKRTGNFEAYRDLEKNMQAAICTRFELSQQEPPSVKDADRMLLAMEARDLMSPLHPDWSYTDDPAPFKIEPLGPQEAKNLFMKRFFELMGYPDHYEHYLKYYP